MKNKWLDHTLYERLHDHNSDFDIHINVDQFTPLSFDEAANQVAQKLYDINNNIYIGLSGGLDSEYVFRKFQSLKIPHTPVIVYSECYKEETSIAFALCEEYEIEPIVIEVTEEYIIRRCKADIKDALNSFGIGAIPAFVTAEYASKNGGIYVKAEHMVGDINGKVAVEVNEWDFYNDVLYPGVTYDFFLHTPEIVYSMVSLMNDLDSQHFKCELYNIPYREKIYANFSKFTKSYARFLIDCRKLKPTYKWIMPPKEFLGKYFNVLL